MPLRIADFGREPPAKSVWGLIGGPPHKCGIGILYMASVEEDVPIPADLMHQDGGILEREEASLS